MNKSDFFTNKWAMILIALFCCILLGSSFPSVKILYTITGVTTMYERMVLAGIRFAAAGILVLAFVKVIQKKKLRVEKQNIKYVLIIALLQTFLGYAFYYIGLSNTTGVRASILVSLEIFSVAILSLFAFKGFKLTACKIIGMVLGLSGVILANSGVFENGAAFKLGGEGLILACTFFMSLASVFIKKYAAKMDIVVLTGWQLFIGGLMLIAVGYAGHPHPIAMNTQTILLLAYVSVLSATAFSLWYLLIKYNSVASVTLFKFTIPIFGSFLSIMLIPEEKFTIILIPSLILVALGIIIFTKSNNTQNGTQANL